MNQRSPLIAEFAEPADPQSRRRLKRVQALAWFLDRFFSIGGKRFGVEPLIGLIPGVGDWIGAILSLYILYEGARLGLPWRVLGQMVGNILVESLVGTVPILGDVIDFVWQANMRNVRLIETNYREEKPGRPIGMILVGIAAFAAVLFIILIAVAIVIARLLWGLLSHAPGPFG